MRAPRRARRQRSALIAPSPAPGGAEDLVPVWRTDAEAPGLILEVMAHVPLPQDPPQRPPRAEVVQVVVSHVIGEVAAEEPARHARREVPAEDQVQHG